MSPQLPDPVRSTMQALTAGLLVILGERLLGVYLGGSLAMGDFCEPSSDVDFLVVTRGSLSLEDKLAIEQLHRELLQAFPFAARLEGDYAPAAWLTAEGTTAPVPGCERGVFLPRVGEIMLSADNIYDMREHGIAFFGPDPRTVLPAVSAEQVRKAVRTMLAEMPGSCDTALEIASEVLNVVRSLCALDCGVPTSKGNGAAWAMTHLEAQWQPVICSAMAVRCGHGTAADEQCLREWLPGLGQRVRVLAS